MFAASNVRVLREEPLVKLMVFRTVKSPVTVTRLEAAAPALPVIAKLFETVVGLAICNKLVPVPPVNVRFDPMVVVPPMFKTLKPVLPLKVRFDLIEVVPPKGSVA